VSTSSRLLARLLGVTVATSVVGVGCVHSSTSQEQTCFSTPAADTCASPEALPGVHTLEPDVISIDEGPVEAPSDISLLSGQPDPTKKRCCYLVTRDNGKGGVDSLDDLDPSGLFGKGRPLRVSAGIVVAPLRPASSGALALAALWG